MSFLKLLFAPSSWHKRKGTGNRDYFKASLKSILFSIFISSCVVFLIYFCLLQLLYVLLMKRNSSSYYQIFIIIFGNFVRKTFLVCQYSFLSKVLLPFFFHLPLVLKLSKLLTRHIWVSNLNLFSKRTHL